MATISPRNNPDADTRTAGGKITRSKRPYSSSRTPYARPTPSPAEYEHHEEEHFENPNWLSNLIYPAKVIASRAGKILSFFGNDSSSSSEEDSENEDDDDEVDNNGSDKVSLPSSKSASKRKIEQLVMEETFSREEADELIKLIKSRLMDTNGNSGGSAPRGRSTPIMEARKWLQEKRSGSKKKLETELDLSPFQLTRSEKGSPVDMAKTFMQNRPAWASPSLKRVELDSPSASGRLHAKEEIPNLTVCSSELKRSSLASGSWNLLEEIRRVRTKATEELLAATPLAKHSLSLFSSDAGPSEDILETKGVEDGAGTSELKHITLESVLPDAATDHDLGVNQDGDAVQAVEHDIVEHDIHLESADLKSNKDNEVNELSTPAENGDMETVDVHGSQDIGSTQEEDFSQEHSHLVADGATAKTKDAPKEKKLRVSTRRGRGRGK